MFMTGSSEGITLQKVQGIGFRVQPRAYVAASCTTNRMPSALNAGALLLEHFGFTRHPTTPLNPIKPLKLPEGSNVVASLGIVIGESAPQRDCRGSL